MNKDAPTTPAIAGAGDAPEAVPVTYRLEQLLAAARANLRSSADSTRNIFDEIEAQCKELSDELAQSHPVANAIIGFDAPANVYVVTEIYRTGGHRRLLEQIIRTHSGERNIVLFTGAFDSDRQYCRDRIVEVGAFPIFPDASLGHFDRLNWLRAKLSAFAAQRIYAIHHPEDALAAIALHEQTGRWRERLYVVHHADTVASLGVKLTEATHLAIRPEQMHHIRQRLSGASVFLLPLTLDRPGPFEELQDRFLARSEGELEDTAVFKPFASGRFVTATAGTPNKFEEDGEYGLPHVLASVLHTTRGNHVHIGPAPTQLRDDVYRALRAAGLPEYMVTFVGEVPSVAATLVERQVDLFLGSFPIGGALTMVEAAAAAVPIVSFGGSGQSRWQYVSGRNFGPKKKLLWNTKEELKTLLSNTWHGELVELSTASARWFFNNCRSSIFQRRLKAIRAIVERRARKSLESEQRVKIANALVDRDFYLRKYPDVKAARMDPVQHFLSSGEEEQRSPNILFDAKYYLAQLSETERKAAAKYPLTHYVMRGEVRGLRPHWLFDPTVFVLSRRQAGEIDQDGIGALATYLNVGKGARPHQFFDPGHYQRQLRLPEERPLLVHFLEEGIGRGHNPHPLLTFPKSANTVNQRLFFLESFFCNRTPGSNEWTTTPLFDAGYFAGGRVMQYAHAAPTLLWAHLIEGNLIDHDPHRLVSIEYIERMRPGSLVDVITMLERLATNQLSVDTHILVDVEYILGQAPYVSSLSISPTQYFLESGTSHNINPHPLFSTEYYLWSNPDVRHAGQNTLMHYLSSGEVEGRRPHPAFDGTTYYRAFLSEKGAVSPLLDYVRDGQALFRPTLPMDGGQARLAAKMAAGLLETGSPTAAAEMLVLSIHPETGARHPTLCTAVHPLRTGTDGAISISEIFPADRYHVDRPRVVAQQHIALSAGYVDAPAATASIYEAATVIAGNDGFLTKDKIWVDHGFASFDRNTMLVRQNAAVVGLTGSQVLLRYYQGKRLLPAGIFATGTYSRNYFHFLLEVLPRVILADRIAPEETPILADAGMPDQHYQALRFLFPARPILRVARQTALMVGKLYVGSMANVVYDAFAQQMPPVRSVQFHPAVVRHLAAVFRGLGDGSGFERLYLQRWGGIRKLLNGEELRSELAENHRFGAIDCAKMGFLEQVRTMARAKDIVGQSGAHLANMLFASEGARVFPLYSNAPGTNFYLWSQLGAILGQEVINIAGWRLPGTSAGVAPEAHEDFTLPKSLLTPFFPASQPRGGQQARGQERARALLDRLYGANSDADILTGAWGTRGELTPAGFEDQLIAVRQELQAVLATLGSKAIKELLAHPFFADFSRNIRSASVTLTGFSADECKTIGAIHTRFEALAARAPDTPPLAARDLALAMMYTPAWTLQLVADLELVERGLRECYLRWLISPPFLFRPGDDAGYVDYVRRLLDWLTDHLAPGRPDDHRFQVAELMGVIDLGQLFLVGEPVRPVLEARNRLLERVAARTTESSRAVLRPSDLSQGRIRIGIMCRTFKKGPDSEAVVSFFRAFDHDRYEIFAYSIDFADRVVSPDDEFSRAFDGAIDHRRKLPADPHMMRERILADDLDVFLLANATTFGVRDQELALFNRVAPLQFVLNSHVPVAPGFPSFDGFITGCSDDASAEVANEDSPERLIRVPGPVINYLDSFKPRPEPGFDRQALGIGPDEFVMFNGGSLAKLRHDGLVTMLSALASVPSGRLVFAPYNPGWVARSQAFAFNRQLAEAASEVGVALDRVMVMGELSVAEAEATVALSDVYLSSFPHGGATMTHLALINGVPPVVLRRRDTRSIDQFLIASLGFTNLLVNTEQQYVDTVRRLSEDRKALHQLSAQLRVKAKAAPFVNNAEYSRSMQAVIDRELKAFVATNSTGRKRD